MTTSARQSWKAVRSQIRDAILTGRYGPGDRLPRDTDIATQLNCARSTVQRAMADLSEKGLVERRRKGGTRVRPYPVTRATLDIPVTRREVEESGSRYGYRLLHATEVPAPESVLNAFGCPPTVPMLHVAALHLADEAPYILEDRWISLDAAPEIRDVDLSRQSANEWLVFHKPYTRVDMELYAQTAEGDIARHMETEPGTALLVTRRTTWFDTAPITTVTAINAPGYRMRTSNEA